ncbi:5-formyltetrahydrofolate cyclo-ligase [Clostridium kluyveri]|uniref:5-formyltetrahydrofolate cyclo-ligase n=2 Tax=Clostridium kluyveri TaxID=1534 RepID=A0A1L5F7A4_CLOKL|nr:5-formyltetrahydrofolate cyclo-ligase [Clostridium kluyveri]APM38869.1 5-formyltetrahydrofolate cyclo-ligase [Clostridium kluyveri]
MVEMNKFYIRKIMKEKRDNLCNLEKEKLDSIIFEKVIKSEEYNKAKSVFIFVSYKSEADTHNIIKAALKEGKLVCVPKVIYKNGYMEAVRIYDFNELKEGAYKILEPQNTNLKVEETSIDICYVPGLAFDKSGGRVGYGGGYYDRFLKKLRNDSKKIGLAYSFQILDKVPMGKYDVCMDGVISN